MAGQAVAFRDNDALRIVIHGRFDYSVHREFRDAYERAGNGVRHYVVDLKNASYMDSSALGMLVLLRDYAGGESASISLAHANDATKRVLAIANFNRMFRIE